MKNIDELYRDVVSWIRELILKDEIRLRDVPVPKDKVWETFIEGLNGFTEDYFEAVESGRTDEFQSEREVL